MDGLKAVPFTDRPGDRWWGVFPSCQNCSIKRTHWAHPAYSIDFCPQ